MKALVSGQAEVAILIGDGVISCMHLGSPAGPTTCGPEIHHRLADATDVETVDAATPEMAAEALELAWRKDRCLHLTLTLLNAETRDEIRRLAAECLEELLPETEVSAFVRNRLFALPLPDAADLLGALLQAETANATCLRDFLEDLGGRQPDIQLHRQVWDALPEELFDKPAMRQEFTYLAIVAGAFREFVEAEPEQINRVLYRCLADPRFHRFPTFRQVFMGWAKPFRTVRPKRALIREDEEQYEEVEWAPERGKLEEPKRRSYSVFETVTKQRDAIKRLLSEGDTRRAFKYVDDLIQYQKNRNEPQDLVRSLCDVAQYAKSIGAHQAQLELVQRAVEIMPTDGWAQAQLGDALLCLSRHGEALTAYNAAVQCGQHLVGRNGRAQVLKAVGRLEEALQEYESIVGDFPHEVVPRCGRAEVLKGLGRLDEALQEYESVVGDFPHEVVPRCGRAEVLKGLGRLDEALQEYESTVGDFPHEVVPRNGRAEVLKALGRLDEALQEYESTIRYFPHEVVPRTGRAEVLKALGRLDEALQEYESAVRDFPHDVVARNGRAEVLKALGRLDEALQEYESTIRYFPHEVMPRTGRAEVLKALGRLEEALQQYERTLERFPASVFTQIGKASVLVLLGRYEEALSLLREAAPRTETDWIALHIRGMVAMKRGDLDRAIEIFGRGIRENPWVADHTYFRTALAVARLRQREYARAAEAVREDTTPVSDALRVHALGAMGRTAEAQKASDRLRPLRLPRVLVLLEEFSERYLRGRGAEPRRSDDWVFDQECALVLTA